MPQSHKPASRDNEVEVISSDSFLWQKPDGATTPIIAVALIRVESSCECYVTIAQLQPQGQKLMYLHVYGLNSTVEDDWIRIGGMNCFRREC